MTSNRTIVALIVLAALSLASNEASATYCSNGALHTSYPQCNKFPQTSTPPSSTNTNTNGNTNHNNIHNKTNSTSSASAQAKAVSVQQQAQQQAQSTAQDQSNLQKLDSSNTAANNGSGNSSVGGDYNRNSMWIFPAPVFTPPLPTIQNCPGANVKQMAASGGWSFLSYADASVNTDNCTAIIIYNTFVETCKYKSAQQVLDLLSKKVLPGFEPSGIELFDLDKKGCDALKLPVVNPAFSEVRLLDNPPPPPSPKKTNAVTRPCPKGMKRNSKGVCYKPQPPCPDGTSRALTCQAKTAAAAK